MTALLFLLLAAQWKTVATLPAAPSGLAIDTLGRVHVSVPDGVHRVSPKGRLALVYKSGNGPAGIAFDPKGRLILCETSDSSRRHPRVVRVDLADGAPETLAEAFGGKALNGPRHVAVDAQGRVFIGDSPGSVLRIDDVGRGAQILASPLVGVIGGLALAGRTLHIASGGSAVQAFALDADGNAGAPVPPNRLPDGTTVNGLCADERGKVFALTPDSVFELQTGRRIRLKSGAFACAASGGQLIVASGKKLLRLR